MLNKLRKDNSGSVVVSLVFVITIATLGFMWTMLQYAVDVIEEEATTSSVTFQFLVWMMDYGILVIMLILLIVWAVSQMQKSKFKEER